MTWKDLDWIPSDSSPPYDIQFCPYNNQRVGYFRRAIFATVKPAMSEIIAAHADATRCDLSEVLSAAASVRLQAAREGEANAVRITYRIAFSETVAADEPTEFLLNPQIIYLPERVGLRQGQQYDLSIAYEASSTPVNSKLTLECVDRVF